PLWNSPRRVLHNPRAMAWIETDDRVALLPFQTGGPTGPNETVETRVVSPRRVELDVSLDRAGVVILADVFYPGWTLTIDDEPAPILRANRLMRGAAVEAGRHRLVYSYEPRSLRVGGALSGAGFLGLFGLLVWARRSGRSGAVIEPL